MPARTQVRLILLEDSAIDAELIRSHLAHDGRDYDISHVMDRPGFEAALADAPDVILADYSLPGFDGLTALELSLDVAPDVPFIFVSGVVGEEFATNAIQAGAVDYVTKRNLRRLPGAVGRALAERHERRERQRAESALRASEVRSRLALAAAGLGNWEYDPIRDILLLDERTALLLGREPGQTTVAVAIQSIHPDDREWILSGGRFLNGVVDEPFSQPFRVLAGTEERWLECRGQVILEGRRIVRVVGVLRDITRQRHAERAMQQSNASLRASVEERTEERDRIWRHSHDLLTVAGLDGRLRSVNPAWTHLLGYGEDQLVSASLARFVHPDDLEALRNARDAMRRTGATQHFESRLRKADGSYVTIAWTTVFDEGALYAVGRDVTEERRAAAELAAANVRLRDQITERERAETAMRQMQRLEAVGQLTSGVAHDFNNLLTVILGNLLFIEKGLDGERDDDKLRRRLGHIRTAAERGAALTGQLLSFARRQRLEPRALQLNETVETMRELLTTTIGGTVSIDLSLQPDLWPALVDANQIELVILNLAINARDAMPGGGNLTLATANVVLLTGSGDGELPPGEYVQLSVGDTGTGMTPEVLARALEPFFTTKEVGKGSGLGLAQVYGFAKQSGGGVQIATEPGAGTTIHVYLPRAQRPEAADHGAIEPVAADGLDDRAILLVDDDERVRDVTAALLRERGFEVLEAASGRAALDLLDADGKVDLLLVDYAMPGMNGGDVVRAARETRPDLPVLFLTGYADLADLSSFSGDRVVQKPFEPAHLVAEIQKSLPRRL